MNTDVKSDNEKTTSPTPLNFGAEEKEREIDFLLDRYKGFDMIQFCSLMDSLMMKAKRAAVIKRK